jgi:RNA polymerase sigma-70 factor (ECF subfamily)
MYAYALPRLGGDASLAEDLVQEALLGGIKGYAGFEGKSSVDTWLIGILRRKIIDHYRSTYRAAENLAVDSWDGVLDEIADVRPWSHDAAEAYKNSEFRAVFDECLASLSPPLAEAFVAVIMDNLDTHEACKLLGITPTNLSVRVHRARLALRNCLQRKWFGSR